MELSRLRGSLILFVLATFDVMGFCSSDSCMPGHRPFTCTNCIMFTENEQLLTSNVCESPSVIFQLEDFDTEILRRYMEVYTASWYWTGYKLIDGVAVIPDTNASVNLNVSTDTCNNDSCCIAWQFNPFGLIAVDCRQAFPVLCTSYVNYIEDTDYSGSGEQNSISISVNEQLLPVSDRQDVMFGANLALNCNSDQGMVVKWYINQIELDNKDVISPSPDSIMLVFNEPGVYQCQISTNTAVDEIRTVTLCGIDGVPGDIEILTATPYSQTELDIAWFPPRILGTSDLLLLRYHLYYTTGDMLNESSKVEIVTPRVQDDIIEMRLSDLNKGHLYVIGVVASTLSTANTHVPLPKLNTLVSTYSEAPTDSVQNLMVERLDMKTLLLSWKSALPDSPVSLYEVEYRDAQQALSNKVRVLYDSTSLILREVTDVNDYEVRVAILVEVKREPLQYNYSPWTDWFRVNGTKGVPPTSNGSTGQIKPTTSENDVEIIVAAVLVPIAVVVVLILLFSVAISYYGCSKRKQKSRLEMRNFSTLEDNKQTNTDTL